MTYVELRQVEQNLVNPSTDTNSTPVEREDEQNQEQQNSPVFGFKRRFLPQILVTTILGLLGRVDDVLLRSNPRGRQAARARYLQIVSTFTNGPDTTLAQELSLPSSFLATARSIRLQDSEVPLSEYGIDLTSVPFWEFGDVTKFEAHHDNWADGRVLKLLGTQPKAPHDAALKQKVIEALARMEELGLCRSNSTPEQLATLFGYCSNLRSLHLSFRDRNRQTEIPSWEGGTINEALRQVTKKLETLHLYIML